MTFKERNYCSESDVLSITYAKFTCMHVHIQSRNKVYIHSQSVICYYTSPIDGVVFLASKGKDEREKKRKIFGKGKGVTRQG